MLIGEAWKGDEEAIKCVEEVLNDVGTGLKSDAEALRGNGEGAFKSNEKVLNCDRESLTVYGA